MNASMKVGFCCFNILFVVFFGFQMKKKLLSFGENYPLFGQLVGSLHLFRIIHLLAVRSRRIPPFITNFHKSCVILCSFNVSFLLRSLFVNDRLSPLHLMFIIELNCLCESRSFIAALICCKYSKDVSSEIPLKAFPSNCCLRICQFVS